MDKKSDFKSVAFAEVHNDNAPVTTFRELSFMQSLMTSTAHHAAPTHGALVDRPKIAELLGVTGRTVRRWEIEEGLPVIKLGRSCRYDVESVRAWTRAHEQSSVVQRAA